MLKNPTPFLEVNTLLQVLLENMQAILGSQFIGMYLDGSLSSGDFDQDSDIDFVVVTRSQVSDKLFLALQTMHDRIAQIDSPLAIQLEGSYISRYALRRYDPAQAIHPNIERGLGERLKLANHNEAWVIHRYILRQRGITVVGPAPQTLIDPVSPDDLQHGMLPLLRGWLPQILNHPTEINQRGYQSYIVLSLCRILYTLQTGDVASKSTAAEWVKVTLGNTWAGLIDRAWVGRHNPQLPAESDDINQTLDFIRFTLEFS